MNISKTPLSTARLLFRVFNESDLLPISQCLLSEKCIVELFTAIFVCLLLTWSGRYSMKQNRQPAISTIINIIPQFFTHEIYKCHRFFCCEKQTPKTANFCFLKGRYFVMGSPIGMNVSVFWETFVGFLMGGCQFECQK